MSQINSFKESPPHVAENLFPSTRYLYVGYLIALIAIFVSAYTSKWAWLLLSVINIPLLYIATRQIVSANQRAKGIEVEREAIDIFMEESSKLGIKAKRNVLVQSDEDKEVKFGDIDIHAQYENTRFCIDIKNYGVKSRNHVAVRKNNSDLSNEQRKITTRQLVNGDDYAIIWCPNSTPETSHVYGCFYIVCGDAIELIKLIRSLSGETKATKIYRYKGKIYKDKNKEDYDNLYKYGVLVFRNSTFITTLSKEEMYLIQEQSTKYQFELMEA